MGSWHISVSSLLRELHPHISRPECGKRNLTSVRYVYVPFGGFIMRYVQKSMTSYQGPNIKIAKSAESAKLGPRSSASVQHDIKAGRLKGQLFACESSRN